MSADELKAQGNAAFAAKDYPKAIDLFSQAIQASPEPNAVLYSNRSGAYAAAKDYQHAATDAEEAIKINPKWAKGYSRKGAAFHGLGDLVQATDAYEEALKIDPANAQAKSGLASVKAAIEREAAADGQSPDLGMAKMFSDPQNLSKLMQNPKTREYLNDPEFMRKFQELGKNPMAALGGAMQDPRLMEAVGVILGIDTNAMNAPPQAGDQDKDVHFSNKSSTEDIPMEDVPEVKNAGTAESHTGAPAPNAASEEETQAKEAANKEKAKGNEFYKKHEFDQAIECYNTAWNLCPDITYLNNRAAAEFEKGDYDSAIATCETAIEQGHEVHADYKLIAKAYGRIGSSYLKLDDYDLAIENFEKSLTEHRSPDILTKLRTAQRDKRVREEQAYLDPAKADEAREKGNELFKKGDLPEAVKEYTESIKRAPKDPRGYGNRAAAFLKLLNYPGVVADCDEAIKLDPSFFKAYTRKATALNIMKQYQQAMKTLEEARKIDTDHKHTREIEELYNKASTGRFAPLPGETEEKRAERLSKDPEIDEIRRDPVMQTILQQASQNPAALRDHMKNPEVLRKINLLAAAGIIQMR